MAGPITVSSLLQLLGPLIFIVKIGIKLIQIRQQNNGIKNHKYNYFLELR